MLNDSEQVELYRLLVKAELGQLVSISTLVQGMIEASVKDSQDSLALLIDKEAK